MENLRWKQELRVSLLFSGIMRNVIFVQDSTPNLHVTKTPRIAPHQEDTEYTDTT
jgi:hypothetical protein